MTEGILTHIIGFPLKLREAFIVCALLINLVCIRFLLLACNGRGLPQTCDRTKFQVCTPRRPWGGSAFLRTRSAETMDLTLDDCDIATTQISEGQPFHLALGADASRAIPYRVKNERLSKRKVRREETNVNDIERTSNRLVSSFHSAQRFPAQNVVLRESSSAIRISRLD